METEPTQADIQDLLKRNKTQLTLNLEGMREPNQDALAELTSAVQYANKTGTKFSIKQALDKFSGAPYGYTEEDIEYLIATLYKKGKISLKMNSVIYTPATATPEEAYKYITRREYREKILLDLKEIPKNSWVKAAKDIIRDFFGHSIVTDDTDSLMRDFKSYCETKIINIEETLREDYGKENRAVRYEHDEVGTRLNYEVMSKAVSFARCAPSAVDMECALDEEELLAPIREDYKRRHRR